MLHSLLSNKVVWGAFTGFVVAFGVDLHAWKSWGDVAFNVKTASFRWVSGAVGGAMVAAGYSQIV